MALAYLQKLPEEHFSSLVNPVTFPQSPKVSSPTKSKKTQQQAACHGEEGAAVPDGDLVFQVQTKQRTESEVPDEAFSDPKSSVSQITTWGHTSETQKPHCCHMAPPVSLVIL